MNSLKHEHRSSWLEQHQPDQQDDIIYALRTARQQHVMLGMQADQKANIILRAFLIFVTVSQSILKDHGQLAIPLWIISAFFSVSQAQAKEL